MDQGSEEWHELRRGKIGASDAPVIMGVSPWCNPQDLWEMKLGLKPPPEIKPHMQRGLLMEAAAREYFYIMTGHEVYPEVYVSPTFEWMMASLDGISKDEKVLLEIKCPGKEDHALAEQGYIPPKYYPQLQHQLAVMQLNSLYYLSYDGQEGVILTVERDQEYIDKLIDKEMEFYQCLQHFIPPAPSIKIESPQWSNAASLLLSVQKKQKELHQEEVRLKNLLIGLSGGKNCEGAGIKLTKCVRKGSVDYERILTEHNLKVNLNDYRRDDIESWKVLAI